MLSCTKTFAPTPSSFIWFDFGGLGSIVNARRGSGLGAQIHGLTGFMGACDAQGCTLPAEEQAAQQMDELTDARSVHKLKKWKRFKD